MQRKAKEPKKYTQKDFIGIWAHKQPTDEERRFTEEIFASEKAAFSRFIYQPAAVAVSPITPMLVSHFLIHEEYDYVV